MAPRPLPHGAPRCAFWRAFGRWSRRRHWCNGGDAEVLQTSAATASADSPSVSKLPAVKSALAVSVQGRRPCTPPVAPMQGAHLLFPANTTHYPPIPATAKGFPSPIPTNAILHFHQYKGPLYPIPSNARNFLHPSPPARETSISTDAEDPLYPFSPVQRAIPPVPTNTSDHLRPFTPAVNRCNSSVRFPSCQSVWHVRALPCELARLARWRVCAWGCFTSFGGSLLS